MTRTPEPPDPAADRRFEADLRATLDDLAGGPAPGRLLTRVAAIPTRAAPDRSIGAVLRAAGWARLPWLGQAAIGLVAAGLAVVIVGAALGLATGQLRVGGPAPSPTPPPSTPTGAPVSAVSTPGPTATLSPTPSPSPTRTLASGLPADFAPVSVTFVSPDEGWVLGSTSCGKVSCAVIARTLDGGRTWTAQAAPPTNVTDIWEIGAMAMPGVGGLRFADPLDGWAFGPDLFATHDGGLTWRQLAVPGGAGAQVWALEAHAGSVQAVISDPSVLGLRVASSPVTKDAWTLAQATLPYGAGPAPEAQLVLSGPSGWVVQNDRVVVAGLRLGASGWSSWQPPCLDVYGPAILAASSATQLVAACDEGVWGALPGGGSGEHLYTSADGGASFVRAAVPIPLDWVFDLSAATSSRIVAVGGQAGSGATAVVASQDGGRTWATVLRPAGSPIYLGFTTDTQGVLITVGHLWMTYDGGRTWQPVTF